MTIAERAAKWRARAAVGLFIVASASLFVSMGLDPRLFDGVLDGRAPDLFVLLLVVPLPLAATLWFFRRRQFLVSWWLVWVAALLMTALGFFLELGFSVIAHEIETNGLIQ